MGEFKTGKNHSSEQIASKILRIYNFDSMFHYTWKVYPLHYNDYNTILLPVVIISSQIFI